MDITSIIELFSHNKVAHYTVKETSRGDKDFRLAIFVQFEDAQDIVIKLADNEFTTQERLEVMYRLVEEYCRLGYCFSPFRH